MDKPILIDALHITTGGGKGLLDYLVTSLLDRKVNFVLLKDERCSKLEDEDKIPSLVVMSSSNKARKTYYKAHSNDFHSILCFGNIPAPIKMPCPVHTYVHNVNIVRMPDCYPFKGKILLWLKRAYIKSLASHSNTWIVQTQNTENLVRENFPCKGKEVRQFPFYKLPEDLTEKESESIEKTDYCLIGAYSWNRGHEELLEAWKILHERGINIPLHLTIKLNGTFKDVVNRYIEKGVPIVNHGEVPFEEVFDIYSKCKATVYPSHGESFGLGIVEAISSGCDVIGSNLPFLYSVCKPSGTFENGKAESIADAVLQYEEGNTIKTECTIKNKMQEFIEFIIR